MISLACLIQKQTFRQQQRFTKHPQGIQAATRLRKRLVLTTVELVPVPIKAMPLRVMSGRWHLFTRGAAIEQKKLAAIPFSLIQAVTGLGDQKTTQSLRGFLHSQN
jgi:hypothetical protein